MKNLKLISKVGRSFQRLSDFDQQMQDALEDIGNVMDVSRIYIFIYEDKGIMRNTFEWCNEGVEPQIQNLQKITAEDVPSFKKILLEKGYIRSNKIDELAKDIVDALELRKIKSIVIYPIIIEKEIKGFVGFDECRCNRRWEAEELEVLKTASSIISGAYERRLFQEDILETESNLNNFFETIDNMFIISDLKGRIIHCNKALINKLEYSFAELKNMNIEELHPEDQREKAAATIREMIDGKADLCSLEVESKNGNIYLVDTKAWFGKWDKQDCIYSIFTDITERVELIKQVEDKCQRLANIIEGSNLGTWEWDIQKGELEINEQWANMLGYSLDELSNKRNDTWLKFAHPEDLKLSDGVIESHLNGETEYYEYEVRMKHKDGSWIWVKDKGKVTERDADGAAKRMFGIHSDITKEKQQALELENFFSINLDLLCILDMNSHFIKVNKAWEDILGYSSEQLKGRKSLEFIHPEDIDETVEVMNEHRAGNKVIGLVNRYISADGDYHYIEWRANSHEGLIYAAARDITERIEYENKILEASNRDSLTNAYNRRYIFDRAESIIKEYKRTRSVFSVCIIDIDFFKKINDNYGHQAGDYVLKEFTKVIDENLRPQDILGRYGGEEFIVILNNSDEEQSELIIKRILDVIRAKTFNFAGENIKFTFSAGISSSREIDKDEVTMDKLVETADQRMYEAKNAGRNKIVYYS